jgi:hypothetical protein
MARKHEILNAGLVAAVFSIYAAVGFDRGAVFFESYNVVAIPVFHILGAFLAKWRNDHKRTAMTPVDGS